MLRLGSDAGTVSPSPASGVGTRVSDLSTIQKALAINLAHKYYGTMSEIGAGQEVSRFFFQAGGASGTIAKTMSAYDMQVSDAIYGEEEHGRYVSRSRVEKMVSQEYPLLIERVGDTKQSSQFFAFANTVAAQGYRPRKDCHGWIGWKGQLYSGAEPSTIILHVRMLDKDNTQQQEALGILGVNLIFAAFHHYSNPEKLLSSLLDNLSGANRIEIDWVNFSGEIFDKSVDNRMIALWMVKAGLNHGAMFDPKGTPVVASEALYKKNVLVARGRFTPPTLVNQDMASCARMKFLQEKNVNQGNTIFLAEMTMAEFMNPGEIDCKDFLRRVELLAELGYTVLVSGYLRFFTLRAYLSNVTQMQIGIVLSVPNIIDIFNEDFYEGIEGGILESFGKLFAFGCKLYVYPRKDDAKGELITTETLKEQVPKHLRFLYLHLLENDLIVQLDGANEQVLQIQSASVLEQIKKGDGDWKNQVPDVVYARIKEKKLFGYGSGSKRR